MSLSHATRWLLLVAIACLGCGGEVVLPQPTERVAVGKVLLQVEAEGEIRIGLT